MTGRARTERAAAAVVVLLVAAVAGPTQAVQTERGSRCTITGTSKADRLVGTNGRDVICGRGGNDVIKGRGGNDLLIGGSGRDTLSGGPGDDVLRAGGGNDAVAGESGRDRLLGDGGNDELDGGPASDAIDGGSGTNWCSMDPTDTQQRCVHDEASAAAHELEVSTVAVDVTDASRTVDIRAHLTDDTGIERVQVNIGGFAGFADLETGNVRDGWWAVTIAIPRWVEPGTYQVAAVIHDRVHHITFHDWSAPVVEVIDREPDRSPPDVLALTSPGTGFVADVRSAAVTVHLRARITDEGSGVDNAFLCVEAPMADGYRSPLPCAYATKVSGTRNDGWWAGDVTIPKGSIGGDWNASVWVEDRAHPGLAHFWYGPDHYRQLLDEGWGGEPRYHQLPGGVGRFRVVGTSDSNAPDLVGLTASPSTVDTLPGPVEVTIRMRATDIEGVTNVGTALTRKQDSPADAPPSFMVEDFALESGTAKDGVWKAVLTLPQGTPVGTYYFQAWVEDATHWRSYSSAGGDLAGQPNQTTMEWDPKVTVVPSS